jgi:hypothetical protein
LPKTVSNEGAGKRHPLNMRTTEEVRRQLENAAALSGRSLAQEVEHRLEQSFVETDIIARALGGRSHADFIKALALGLQIVLAKTGKESWADPEVQTEMVVFLGKIIHERMFYGNPDWAARMAELEKRAKGAGAEAADGAFSVLGLSPRRARKAVNT